MPTIQLTSTAFKDGEVIPRQHTCDGENLSPPLAWSGIPASTRSLALIADDPDAPSGTWVHWVVYNLDAAASALPQGVAKYQDQGGAGASGTNSFRKPGYSGPCPPAGPTHRYYFKLYALDTSLNLKSGASKEDLLKAMQGHILAQGQLMGRYARQK
jgi:Raf kinase inhibitor-like YbhB/YbcL family protein